MHVQRNAIKAELHVYSIGALRNPIKAELHPYPNPLIVHVCSIMHYVILLTFLPVEFDSNADNY